ncbi:MAG: PQQ-dependent sugar dehydrogenase, partial [Limisphaerales bacterium]
ATVWTGPLITYSQPAPDPKQAGNQDRITPKVWITRDITQGLFNAKTETNYAHFVSPADTEWADGDLTNYSSLTYNNWETWAKTIHGGPPNTVGLSAVVHLISEDIYLGIKVTQWAVSGGGFAYQRTTAAALISPVPLEIRPTPNAVVLSWTNSDFSLQSATNIAGPFVTLPGAVSPFTNIASDSAGFFRLVH